MAGPTNAAVAAGWPVPAFAADRTAVERSVAAAAAVAVDSAETVSFVDC